MVKQHGRWRGPSAVEEVEARAARLGITPDRVLQEYASLGFSSLRDIVEWDEKGIKVKPSIDLADDKVAAIVEIVAAAGSGKIYRIKMHDKKPVLDALARHLGLLPPAKTEPHEDEEEAPDGGEDPREFLVRELDRADAEDAAGADPGPEA